MTFISTTPFYPPASVQGGSWTTELKIKFCPAFFVPAPGYPEIRPQLRKLQRGMKVLEGKMRRGDISVQTFNDANAYLSLTLGWMMGLVCEGGGLGQSPNPNSPPDSEIESLVQSGGHGKVLDDLGRRLDATLSSGAPLAPNSSGKPGTDAPPTATSKDPTDAAGNAGRDAP